MCLEIEKIKKVKNQFEKDWFKIEEIVAVGIGKISSDKLGIIISVKKNLPKIQKLIPSMVNGIPVKIEEVGEIKIL
jgi:hypothetical protein